MILVDYLCEWFGLPLINWIDDGWFGLDKIGHFLLHCAIGFTYAKWATWWGGLFFSEAFGFAWEMYDGARGVGASWKDLIANNLGFIVGTTLGLVV